MLHQFVDLLLSFTSSFGYFGIVFLMAIESSFIPFPSEVVIPPAAYLASMGEMNIFLVVIMGIIGSLIGASLNYFLAYYLGRKLVYFLADHKLSRFILLSSKKIGTAEDFFLKHGRASTFFGRLIPVVRQLISIPAGFSRMNFSVFLLYTFFGSSIWIIILAMLGYYFGNSKELLEKYFYEANIVLLVAVFLLLIFYILKRNKKK